MTAQKDAMDVADALTNKLDYMQTLLRAARDKVRFYLCNGPQLGHYRELLAHHAADTDALLELMGQFLDQMAQEMETVSDLLYQKSSA